MNLATKLEYAAKLYFQSYVEGSGYNGYANTDSEKLRVPYALFTAEVGDEMPLYSGNFRMRLSVTVHDSADTGPLASRRASHEERSGILFDAFYDTDLDTLLSGLLEDFTILDIFGRSGTGPRQEDRQWISEIEIELYGCNADFILVSARPAPPEPDGTVIGDQSGNIIGDSSGGLIGVVTVPDPSLIGDQGGNIIGDDQGNPIGGP